jgi:hypothetical protein
MKRSRTDGGSTAASRGRFASSKFSKLHPWQTYGAARVQRGTPDNIAHYGATARSATAAQRANRKSSGYTGKGLYIGRGSFWSDLESGADRFLRKGLPMAINAAQKVKNFMGRGVYTHNNLIEGGRPSMTFSSPNDETQSLVLTHKEYIGDVFAPGSSAFSNTSYPINPGLSQNFPFLAQFATNFDEYELIQMVFEFHSTIDASATSNAAGNTGTVIMATNYKSDAPLFSTKEEMIQYHGGVSGRLTENLIHGVECDPYKNALGGQKFVRSAFVANSDLKTYDSGIFQLAIQNIPSAFFNQQVGELWVHYKVKLTKPKLSSSLGNSATVYRAVSKGSETAALPMGDNVLTAISNNLPMGLSQITKGIVLTFPATASGVYEIKVMLEGTVLAVGGSVGAIATGNVVSFSDIYGSGAAGDSPAFQLHIVNTTNAIAVVRVACKAATGGTNNTLTIYPIGDTGTATTVTQCSVEVYECGNQLATSNTIASPLYINASGVQTSVV